MLCPTCESVMRVLSLETPIVRILYRSMVEIEANRSQVWVPDPIDVRDSRIVQCPKCETVLVQPMRGPRANGLAGRP